MQEYTKALYDRCRDPVTEEIIDPITQETIDEKDVWILSHNEESISYTSIQTLYKSLVLDNKTVSPFDRTPIDELDIEIIEEYGRARKIRVRFFDAGRNYDSPYRDTMYIFDWFLSLKQALIRVFKATNNMQRHKSLLFVCNGKDITEYDLNAEIESIAENGEIILSAVENPEYHREENTLREAVTNILGESFMVGIPDGERIARSDIESDESGNILTGASIGHVVGSGTRSESIAYQGDSTSLEVASHIRSLFTGIAPLQNHNPNSVGTGWDESSSSQEEDPEELEEPEAVEMVFPSAFADIFRNFVQPQPQEPTSPETQQNFISTMFDQVAQNARSSATAEVIRNPNSGMMDLFNTLMTPNVTQNIPPPTQDTEDLDLD